MTIFFIRVRTSKLALPRVDIATGKREYVAGNEAGLLIFIRLDCSSEVSVLHGMLHSPDWSWRKD